MLTPQRVVIVLMLIGSAAACAEPPASVPARQCPLQADSPDYIITCDLKGDGDWRAWVAIGWRSPTDCLVIEIDRANARLYRLDETGARPIGAGLLSPTLRRMYSYSNPPASEIAPGTSAELRVRRRGADLIVSVGERLMARALIEDDLSGRAGVWGDANVTLGEPTIQPLGEIAFDEDFFEREQVPNRWETVRGEWQVGVYWDPLQKRDNYAPGACWYQPGEGECLAAAGHWFWDSYRAEVTVRLTHGAVGLACHVGDDGTAHAFVISEGQARMLHSSAGRWSPSDSVNVAVRSGQWYRLAMDVLPGRLIGYLNGRRVADMRTGPARTGRLGLLALDAAGSEFDDVRVRGLRGVVNAEEDIDFWTWRGGEWNVDDDLNLVGRVKGAQVAALKAGDWTDCVIRANVRATRGCTAGLVTHHRFGDRAYLFTITAGRHPVWHLHAVEGGKTEKLAEGPARESGGMMELSWVGGRLEGSLNGRTLVRTWDFRAAPGRAGVYVSGGRAHFNAFTCTEPERAPARAICEADGTGAKVPALEEKVFISKIGGLWRRVSGRWRSGNVASGPTITGTPSGDEARARFHEVTPGDVRVVADVLTPAQGGDFGLALCAGDTAGYRLNVRPGAGTADLQRNGTVVAEVSGLQLRRNADTIELLRDGAWIVARLGQWQGVAFLDPEPLPSGYAEVYVTGKPLNMSRLVLTGDDVLIYPFNRPEPDWLPASGKWSEHTGMACIFWDYWMSGDAREEPALIWNRHRLPEDVTVDVQVSEYTEGYPDGEHKHFPYHDAKIVLCGRPDTAGSGYTFIAGADGGGRTVLLRNGVEVASTDDTRFRIVMGGHCNSPRAIQLRAVKRGGHLSLTITGRVALEWDDPDPLPAGQVGLGLEGCRANFRDCVIYPDLTWKES
ncbi:MAG: hypothetical protein J7M38_04220 [Armatimonadetes bacterium]|nr:hypothetical protein [Armatimonadota bacterium]